MVPGAPTGHHPSANREGGEATFTAGKYDYDVGFWHLADIHEQTTNVRFWGQSGHWLTVARQLPIYECAR